MGDKIVKRTVLLSEGTKNTMTFGICLACIFLFLSSAFSKIADYNTFVQGLTRVSRIGPYAQLIGWFVPMVEIIVSILLIIPKTNRIGLFTFIGIMIVFTIYISFMLLWAEKLPCHCNLIIKSFTWAQHLSFNLSFIGIAGFALRISKTNVKS